MVWKKYQFLLKLLTMISEKYFEHRIWGVILKAINARYCHFANTSYCGVKKRTLSNGVAIKEGNQIKMKLINKCVCMGIDKESTIF